MANETNKLIADSLLLFASAKTQLEGGRALLEQARKTLVKLGGCERELECIGDCERASIKALALLEHKIRYVSALTPGTVREEVAAERFTKCATCGNTKATHQAIKCKGMFT